MEYHSSIKKDEILPFPVTWMDLETIMPSEVSQRNTSFIQYQLYVKSKK